MKRVPDGGWTARNMAPLDQWTAVLAAMLILILVPFFIFEDSLTEFGTALLQSETRKPLLAVLVAGLLASDVLLPVPSSLVSSFAGHMLGFTVGLLAVWSGMMLGCLVGYWIGACGGAPVVRKVVGERELTRVQELAARYGADRTFKDERGRTILMRAIQSGLDLNVLQAVLSKPPQLDAVDRDGKNAYSFIPWRHPPHTAPSRKNFLDNH